MKRLLIALIFSITMLAACNNNASTDKDRQDSLAADQAADSMLNAATSADTLAPNETVSDSEGVDSLKLPNTK